MSKFTLVIGNKNYSSWSLRPWIFLRHHQIEFEEKWVSLFIDTTVGELAEYDSDFKVPILKDGELVVWDSLSILEYVSEVYLDNKGWPKDRKARAVARSISSEMHSSFSNIRNELPMNCRKKFKNIRLSQDAEHEVERVKKLWRKCRNEYGGKGEWLFGEYSIADAMYAPIALRFNGYSIPLSGIEENYVKNVLNHPGVIEWVEAGKLETEIIEEDEIET
ncbi:MAG: glutathione S-transferase family protein [Gammaproteobacteria bacterium]|nr:glutathione S-transferase family protein [Gammaproteobacteria bacterium]